MAGEIRILIVSDKSHAHLEPTRGKSHHRHRVDVDDASNAREIIKLPYATESEELHKSAERVEELPPILTRIERSAEIIRVRIETKYVTSLR